jgi:hypothetical protein
MPKHKPEHEGTSSDSIEHAAPRAPRRFTAWHYYLARVLEKTAAPGFQVHSFVKLGSLPLEADIILLHLDKNADISTFAKYFSFLVPSLRSYLLLEFKSPQDRLTLADFDTVRAYAMLCKRKYKIAHDEEVAVAMLYSRAEADFFDGCARNGFAFAEVQMGVRGCNQHPIRFSAVDLVAFGQEHPDHPINLLSARRREFWPPEGPERLGPFDVLWDGVFQRELQNMSQRQIQGHQELLDEAARVRALIISSGSVEERLSGIPPEEMLRHLSAAERARLRELLLTPEQSGPVSKPHKK